MEVNAQLLGGAAVTVFLALLFFGVVVLWDVALALRSVGDKIDKLEDNIDDDLTDIGHSLDNISNAPGGGGGTQLHLSGGTISSGPTAGQAQGQPTQGAGPHAATGGTQQPRQPAQQPREYSGGTAGADAAAAGSDAGIGRTRADTRNEANGHPGDGETAAGARAADAGPAAGGAETTAGGAEASEVDGPLSDTEFEPAADDVREPEPAADDAPTEPVESPDETGTAEDDATAVDADAGDDDTGPDSAHPRADHNPGRFVASPDRTAWYAVRLDREAISDAEPSIAGELTDGSETDGDGADVIAAGPGESTATVETAASASETAATGANDSSETADDPVVAAPPADATDAESTAGSPAETATTDESDDRDVEPAPADSDADLDETEDEDETEIPSNGGETDGEADEADADDDPDEGDHAGGEDSAIDRDGAESDDDFASDETDSAAETPSDGSIEAATDDGSTEPVDEPVSGQSDRPQAETELEPVEEADDVPDDSAETDSEAGSDRSDDGDSGSDAETAVDAGDPLAGDVTAFEFDEEELDDVTVEEAVDTINEDAPAPELSSHQFDVSAEVYGADEDGDDGDGPDADRDDDGEDTVLTYEFDTDTVEISGSTKRLLQYQLRSFADRDATPEADVSIGPDRIVIEIPDSDGEAVQRWSEAAVDIIDRTLYLSDNSSDDR